MTTDPFENEFAACPDRKGTGSEKWDRWSGQDVLPMWVADMDFCTPREILDAIHQRTQHGVFGYTHEPPGFADALANHLQRQHSWNIDPSRVIATPGVVTGLAMTARLLSQPDDEILTFTPVYPPFLSLPGMGNRRCVRIPLIQKETTWDIDWETFKASITPRAKIFWLCHPHNPTGLVFTKENLLRIADICEEHRITVVSDEIWSDLIIDPQCTHIPFASLHHDATKHAITLVAPSKTWNLAGLGCAAAILPSHTRRKQWIASGGGLVPMINPLGYAAAEAAWNYGDAWRQKLLTVLRTHHTMIQSVIHDIAGLSCIPAQATYLSWIDCRPTPVKNPMEACIRAGLGPSDGHDFGAPGFIRLNIACPTARLEDALDRLKQAFRTPFHS
ncbi:MAG: PatB family C-S lyase [Pirellulales bacterium]